MAKKAGPATAVADATFARDDNSFLRLDPINPIRMFPRSRVEAIDTKLVVAPLNLCRETGIFVEDADAENR